MHTARSAEMDRCIEACISCHEVCTESVVHCLSLGGRHADVDHIRALMDCAAICLADAGFMMRQSPQHTDVCGVCATVCERCADSCAGLANEHQMQLCADECRRCAELCRAMATTHAH